MKKLISMKDFVLDRYDKVFYGRANGKNAENYISQTNAYAKFLSQPLTLSMFVAVDEDGDVLVEPDHLDYKFEKFKGELHFKSDRHKNEYCDKYEQYDKAKSRVLFEGFEVVESIMVRNLECQCGIYINHLDRMTVENLMHCSNGLPLTETATTQIFG